MLMALLIRKTNEIRRVISIGLVCHQCVYQMVSEPSERTPGSVPDPNRLTSGPYHQLFKMSE